MKQKLFDKNKDINDEISLNRIVQSIFLTYNKREHTKSLDRQKEGFQFKISLAISCLNFTLSLQIKKLFQIDQICLKKQVLSLIHNVKKLCVCYKC